MSLKLDKTHLNVSAITSFIAVNILNFKRLNIALNVRFFAIKQTVYFSCKFNFGQ